MENPFLPCTRCETVGEAANADGWQHDMEGATCPECLALDA